MKGRDCLEDLGTDGSIKFGQDSPSSRKSTVVGSIIS